MEFLFLSTIRHYFFGFAIVLLGYFIFASHSRTRSKDKIPLINQPKWFEPTSIRVKLTFALNARKWITKGVETDKPFRLLTDIGELTVLPSKFARELRADPRLDFAAVINRTFHANLPGFEGFREGTPDAYRTRDVVRRHLTNCSDEVITSISEECHNALRDVLSESTDWSEVNLRENVLQIIARMSSQVFLGNEGASNDAWLKITMEYTTNAYIAALVLRMFPESLRSYVHWVIPQCRKLRKEKASIQAEGRPPRIFDDVIEWFAQDEKNGHSDYDPVVGQLILMQAAIHTTTDLLTQSMLDIALHPEMAEALRKDVEQAVHQYGWSKSSLAEMHLVDAAIKESQRLKPIARTSMHRLVLNDIELSDGTLISKDSILGISVDQMWNANLYDSPAVWNPHRFYQMSQAGDKAGSLTSTSPDYLAWGYGKHACAGRFFVAQEVKVALSQLLLHYEWRLVPSSEPTKPLELGLTLAADPMARVMVRRVSKNI